MGIHHLQEGLKRMPHSCFAWNALGVAQARLGALEDALVSLEQGLFCDPESAGVWVNLALVYAHGNAPAQATEALERAVALNSTNPSVRHNSMLLSGQAPEGTQPIFDLYIPLPGSRR